MLFAAFRICYIQISRTIFATLRACYSLKHWSSICYIYNLPHLEHQNSFSFHQFQSQFQKKNKSVPKFLVARWTCAIATDKKTSDTVWFVFNENMKVVEKNKVDSFDCDIAEDHIFISGWNFEQSGTGKLKIQTNENRCFFLKERGIPIR